MFFFLTLKKHPFMKIPSLKITIVLVFSLFQSQAYSQFNSSYLKLIGKEKYTEVEKKLIKDLQKKPENVEMNFSMAVLYNTKKFEGYQPEKAYDYLQKAYMAFGKIIKEKELKKLNKIPVNKNVLDNMSDSICKMALNDAIEINTVEVFEKYLTLYKTAPEAYQKHVVKLRNELQYQAAAEKNTIDSYQEFISRYSEAEQIPEATKRRNQLAFEQTKRLNKIANYKDFISKYPDAVEVLEAYEKIDELAFIQAERENTTASYKYFIEEYPSSKQYKMAFNLMEKRQFIENTIPGDWKKYKSFIEKYPYNQWKRFAQDSIYLIGLNTENPEILNYCVDNFDNENKQRALALLYKIFTRDGEKTSLDMFYSKYDDEIFYNIKIDDYKVAALGDSVMRLIPNEINKPIFENYIKLAAPKDKAFLVLKKLIKNDIDRKDWTAAYEKITQYSTYFGEKNKQLNDLIYFLSILKTTPKVVNTFEN